MLKSILTLFFFAFVAVNLSAQTKTDSLNTLLDNWHKAASDVNANAYFGFMSDNSIYIGTDSWERWNKQEFVAFGKPYFDKGKAWSFTAFDRQIFLSSNGQTAWFNELLRTQMGICRASGILSIINGEWKLEQYHLSVTLPNEELPSFIKLVEGKQKTTKPE